MELPFYLRTLEPLPGALDILRFFHQNNAETADVDQIIDALGLSDRGFNKAIRRLVTKNYVQMDGDGIYRLTEQGRSAVAELIEYDQAGGGEEHAAAPAPTAASSARQVQRRLVMALPRHLPVNGAATVVVGFDAPDTDSEFAEPVDLVLRLSVENGEPSQPEDNLIKLDNAALQDQFQIMPDAYTQVRLRVEVLQLDNDSGDINPAGGMYVDAPVSADGIDENVVAFGTDITFTV